MLEPPASEQSQARDDESQDAAKIPAPGARVFVEVCRCWSTPFCPCCERWNAGIAPDGSAVTD